MRSSPVEIVAEIGMTHDGSFGQAKAMIKAAAGCKADAVKFQTHIAEAETLPDAPSPAYFENENRYEYFVRTAFSLKEHVALKQYAERNGVEFISSPFSIEAVELLEQVGVTTFKIPSGEVTNTPYLIRVAQTGKRVLLSSGMSTWSELDEAVKTLREHGCRDLVLLQCTSEYPCPPEHAGLNVLLDMKERYDLPIGLSDHTLGIAVSIAAVALGACIVEKHFTLSKFMYGPDAKFSADPGEFKTLVQGIRDVEVALAHQVDKDELAISLRRMKTTFEKSVMAACDLPSGTKLEMEHLAFKKPGDGISAREYEDLLGRTLSKDVKKDQRFSEGDFV